tara:strand:+ start:136 stop:567 length:432 start_codon:yes stop_codon:yes gene_type:complete
MAAFLMEKTRTRGKAYRPMAEINVTPFVDVMLVLLVVFMVTAPLLTVGVSVDLPRSDAPAVPGKDEPLAVTINKEGTIFLQDTEVKLKTLPARLNAITNNNTKVRIFVRGDRSISYGKVMEVMGVLTKSGFTRVALITEKPQK